MSLRHNHTGHGKTLRHIIIAAVLMAIGGIILFHFRGTKFAVYGTATVIVIHTVAGIAILFFGRGFLKRMFRKFHGVQGDDADR